MDYKVQLKSLFEAIQNHPNIEVELVNANFYDTQDSVDAVNWMFGHLKEEKNYIELSDEFYNSLFFLDSFELSYSYSTTNFSARNNIEFRQITGLMSDYEFLPNFFAFHGLKSEERKLWESFEYFDSRPEIGDNRWGVVSFMPGISPPAEPPIYFIDRALAVRLSINYSEYIDAMIDMAGIAAWQILFAYPDRENPAIIYDTEYFNNNYYEMLKKQMNALVELFPHIDYTKYFTLLEAKSKDVNAR